MNLPIIAIPAFFILVIIAAMLYLRFARRKRELYLRKAGKVISIEVLMGGSYPIKALVGINFGYGLEIWAFSNDYKPARLNENVYDDGYVILPKPSPHDIVKLCKQLGCEYSERITAL